MIEDLSLPQREREYAPSSCIGGNYAPHLHAYAQRSAAALQSGARHAELAYGQAPSQRLDLFLPCVEGKKPQLQPLPPLLVFIHGGYWQELSKASSLFPAPDCNRAGFAFAAIDYTLAPQASVRDIALECRRALRWLHAHAQQLGFDPARIVVSGSSAGAHLAAMCCVRQWTEDTDLPEDLPASAVLVSGIYSLEPLVGTSINAALSLDTASASVVSPQLLAVADFPACVVCWGEIETSEFKRQSRAFAARLEAISGKSPLCIEVPGRNHFDVILDLAKPGSLLGDATLALMAASLSSSF